MVLPQECGASGLLAMAYILRKLVLLAILYPAFVRWKFSGLRFQGSNDTNSDRHNGPVDRILLAKPEDLSSIPETCMVGKRVLVPKSCPLTITCAKCPCSPCHQQRKPETIPNP